MTVAALFTRDMPICRLIVMMRAYDRVKVLQADSRRQVVANHAIIASADMCIRIFEHAQRHCKGATSH